MNFLACIQKYYRHVKYRLRDHSVDGILWLINLVPTLAGFSLNKERINVFGWSKAINILIFYLCHQHCIKLTRKVLTKIIEFENIRNSEAFTIFQKIIVTLGCYEERVITPFWILHISLLIYVYGIGNLVYQIYYAKGARDFIKSYVNVSLLILISSNSYWFLKQWPLLKSVLNKIKENDELAKSSSAFRKKHERMLRNIKIIVLVFYGLNYINEFCIYLPHRADVNNDFSMTPCIGIEPLTVSPNREICMVILGMQELSIVAVVLNYQTLLLFLIDHTSAMYLMMAEEMLAFNDPAVDNDQVKTVLPSILKRHILTMDIIDKLKKLYSIPIGINFGSNAVCISLFFYLPLQEWLGFVPILVYCFLVFFLYCFLCQRLINAAEVFERAVYACGWEKFDVPLRKIIYTMLLIAQRNVVILAADIIPVNIYTFATTLQAMFKFVTVVKFN